MTTITRSVHIDATPAAVWAILADFGSISGWAPDVDHSCLLTTGEVGPDTVRRIQAGRTTVLERITTWEPERTLSYEITGLPPMLRAVTNTWSLAPDGSGTAVTLTTEIRTGPRPPHRIAGRVAGRLLGKASDSMLAGLAAHLGHRRSQT